MKKVLSLVLLLAGCRCGGVDPVQEVRDQVPSVVETPAGPELLPAGWYLHAYPAQCAFVVRDQDGVFKRCIDDWKCTPTDPRRCGSLRP